jgi:hypothetical protein
MPMWINILLSFQSLFPTDEKISSFEKKISKNELSFSKYHLVYWNPHEPFLSLGIGHFIWFPKGQTFPFEEAFPNLLKFLKAQNCQIPSWIDDNFTCPWQTRTEFEKDHQKQIELKRLLESSTALQTRFIVKNSFEVFDKIISSCDDDSKKIVEERIKKLLEDPRGLFALIDYNHFKGSGLCEKEFKYGKGFGLKQVLLSLSDDSINLDSFVKTAQDILKERVRLSRGQEDKWLSGWLKRIDRYRQI